MSETLPKGFRLQAVCWKHTRSSVLSVKPSWKYYEWYNWKQPLYFCVTPQHY